MKSPSDMTGISQPRVLCDKTVAELLLPETVIPVVCNDRNEPEPPTSRPYDAIIDFIGGVAGGIASVYVGQPLDTVKVKLQTFPGLYKNAWDCFKHTLTKDGVRRGLYAGTVPSLFAAVSENSVLFMSYGLCQKVVMAVRSKYSIKDLNPLDNAISGALAAFFAAFALCPTELIKCKLQTLEQLKKGGKNMAGSFSTIDVNIKYGPWTLTKYVLKTEGVSGMFSGLIPTLFREVPGAFFFFGGYEVVKSLLVPYGVPKEEISVFGTVIAGAVGGICFWLSIYPADVVKSRAQVYSGKCIKFFPTVLKIYKQEGFFALYRGIGPCLIRTAPASASLFLAYEYTKAGLSKLAYGDAWRNK